MNDIFENYKSPITVYSDFEEQIMQEQENQIMCKIKTVVDIDREELIKALNYDRNQYEAGYKAGVQQMRQHGQWEYWCGRLPRCPVCGFEYTDLVECKNFCGNCGAIMEEVKENESSINEH